MFPLARSFLKFASIGSLVAFFAAGTPARADEAIQNLGPIGPHEPILATVGSMRVIAFFLPSNGRCNLQAVIWDGDDAEARTAMGIRVSLSPGQTASIDSVENKSVTLRCGDHAESLAALSTELQVASK
ncbi:MAG TPA: hypothetical protein VJL59_15710 [Anaerolineales bacterium]|jgi:hypothetical protein|nr:hypothetical protein [Anaerolineales bacterium]